MYNIKLKRFAALLAAGTLIFTSGCTMNAGSTAQTEGKTAIPGNRTAEQNKTQGPVKVRTDDKAEYPYNDVLASSYVIDGDKGGKITFELSTNEKKDHYLKNISSKKTVGKFTFLGKCTETEDIGKAIPDFDQSDALVTRSVPDNELYRYSLSGVFPAGSRYGAFRYGTDTDNAVTIHIVTTKNIGRIRKIYGRKFSGIMKKYYGKYSAKIKKDAKKDIFEQVPYYNKAYKAAVKTEDKIKELAGELQDKGYVLSAISRNSDVVRVTWSDRKTTDFDFMLSKIEGFHEYVSDKPVIYTYPEKSSDVRVSIDNKDGLTCVYPEPGKRSKTKAVWDIKASPDGTITDKNGQIYNYLYWEGMNDGCFDMSHGFCVRGADTAEFLDKTLDKIGLTRKEANEFIVYWLPKMEKNRYNVISFQTDAYTKNAKLKVTPKPDTMIRVFMAWYGTDSRISIPEQKIVTPERKGFTVVEWGGSEVKTAK